MKRVAFFVILITLSLWSCRKPQDVVPVEIVRLADGAYTPRTPTPWLESPSCQVYLPKDDMVPYAQRAQEVALIYLNHYKKDLISPKDLTVTLAEEIWSIYYQGESVLRLSKRDASILASTFIPEKQEGFDEDEWLNEAIALALAQLFFGESSFSGGVKAINITYRLLKGDNASFWEIKRVYQAREGYLMMGGGASIIISLQDGRVQCLEHQM